jgi:hypothetical protein
VIAAVDETLGEGKLESAFAPTRSPQETWQRILQFYEGYPDYPWWESVRRFLPLVRRIAASPLATKLYASQSHETLVVSSQGTAPERENAPCFMIAPGERSICVTKYQRGAHSLGEQTFPLAEAWSVLQPYFDWLVANSEQSTPADRPHD